MPTDNIAQFNTQVLRAVAILYQNFPHLVSIDNNTFYPTTKKSDDGSVTVAIQDGSEHGTMIWLYRNNVISGDLQESKPLGRPPTAFISSAQLTSRSLALLQRVDYNAGRPLGEAAMDAVNSDTTIAKFQSSANYWLGV
jgi:hypothetical protein